MKEVIAIDIGGTYMRFAYVKNGKIHDYLRRDTPKNKNDILNELVNGIKDYVNKNTKGIGVSCAGFIEDGIIKDSPNLPLENTNLKRYLQSKFKKNVKIENDANCVALAERKFGVKKKNFFILTLGTGVGGGIIINGQLYKGKGGGGELGSIIINQGKNLEYYFKKSKESTAKMSDYIGQGIASLTQVLDPEIVVLSGGMKNLGKTFLNQIRQKTKKHCSLLVLKSPEIKWSGLKHPGLIGASLLFK